MALNSLMIAQFDIDADAPSSASRSLLCLYEELLQGGCRGKVSGSGIRSYASKLKSIVTGKLNIEMADVTAPVANAPPSVGRSASYTESLSVSAQPSD